MKILIDGDSCNKLKITEEIAKSHNIDIDIYCDTHHMLESEYATIHIVDCMPDSADFALINNCDKNDIVITNDSGLASMVLTKNAFVLNTYGIEYTTNNIMKYLNSRHIRKQVTRKQNRDTIKSDKQVTQQHLSYDKTLENIIQTIKKQYVSQ